MKTTHIHRQSGIAIIVVMISVAVLSFLTAIFAYNMKVETRLAQNANSEVELMWLGRSGVEYARWILAQQLTIASEPYDSLNQVWAGGPGGTGTTNSVLSGISLKDYPLGGGTFSLTIVDLERKVNINIVDDIVLEQAFNLIGVDPGESSGTVGAILDWVDPDDDARINGTESDFYQGLEPPYFAKNAPIDDLSELLLVKGVTPQMYWGGEASRHPATKFQAAFGRADLGNENANYASTLQDIFTPISTGRININTASVIVLQMIPGVDENIANAIIQQRAGPDGQDGTDDDVPFQNVNELATVGITREQAPTVTRVCTVRSSSFEVTVDADIDGYKRRFVAIVGRNSTTDLPILSFYWK